jgi:shikimate kinase
MGHIWLIGMMGSGKTTIGGIVAEHLSMPLVDTDAVVMERSGRTVSELFAVSEETFRSEERSAIEELASGPPSVISTGGGAVLDDANVRAMRATGVVVLLEAAVEVLEARLVGDGTVRPLIESGGDLASIAMSRSERYRDASDHAVNTEDRSIQEIAEDVVRCART